MAQPLFTILCWLSDLHRTATSSNQATGICIHIIPWRPHPTSPSWAVRHPNERSLAPSVKPGACDVLERSNWFFREVCDISRKKNYAVMTLSAAAFTRGNCWLFILLVSFMNGNSVRPLKVYLVCEEDPEIINNRLVTKKTSLSPSNVPFSSGCFSENWPPHIWSSYVFKIISRHSSHLVRISRGRSISKTFH